MARSQNPTVIDFASASKRHREYECVITQDDLYALYCARGAAWFASKQAWGISEEIQTKLALGATIEPGKYSFDAEEEAAILS